VKTKPRFLRTGRVVTGQLKAQGGDECNEKDIKERKLNKQINERIKLINSWLK